jgi:uncharacterized protein (TIGR00299 family) protein
VATLRDGLAKLQLPESYTLDVAPTKKGAISASLLQLEIAGQEGHEHRHEHHHSHSHDGDHDHPHTHSHEHVKPVLQPSDHSHEHSHQRSMHDIAHLIEDSSLSATAKANSLAIFWRLAQAEGKVHGQPPEEVHFHEVGAVDSILDIVGAAIGLEALGIERLYSSPLPLGSGQVKTQHGLLPLPAPATLELMRAAQIPVVPSPAQKELVTPTGAAILATLATFEQPAMRIVAVGTGAGQRELPWPNILRLIVGEVSGGGAHGELVLIETNIDDMAAHGFGQVMTRLFAGGALDVYFTPIYMKKNRPATMLSVIASRLHEPALARILLEETTTFGMRVQPIARYEAEREMRKVLTPFGEIDVKLKILEGKVVQAIPEYETCLRLAEQAGVPFLTVYQAALAAGRGLLKD